MKNYIKGQEDKTNEIIKMIEDDLSKFNIRLINLQKRFNAGETNEEDETEIYFLKMIKLYLIELIKKLKGEK